MNLESAAITVLIFWMLTTPHEFAHAWTAVRLGDDTPRLEGRLTLNPLAHVDWIGTVILPVIGLLIGGFFIGWGRPVSTNPSKLRGGLNGLALVALAGPASNVIFALVLGALAAMLGASFAPLAERAIYLSLYLALFNLLPVPPLDGSKLLLALRAPRVIYEELARFGFILLIVAMVATDLGLWLLRASEEGTRRILTLF
jgi:Zn-dependent protease